MLRQNSIFRQREILAFTHIPKTGGTTLHNLLRPNYFMRCCEVESFSKKRPNSVFEAEDMRKVMIINPLVKCIGGHEVFPFGNLTEAFPKIKFITLLRDPVKRCISHYLYTFERERGQLKDLDDYLSREWSFNMQTKLIAGSYNLSKAKDILDERFLLTGIVEEFDGFLILLKRKLEPIKFRINYRARNVANRDSTIRKNLYENLDKYIEQIKDRNSLDLELYSFVKNEILPKEKREYGPAYKCDLERFKKLERRYSLNLLRYLDYILRKFYYKPMFNFVKKLSD